MFRGLTWAYHCTTYALIFVLLVSPLRAFAVDPPPTLPNAQLFTSQSSSPKVDQSTGALVHRVPLDIPPGRNGLTPDVALVYNSQDLNDGIAGYGWSLSIPYIERLNKTGTDRLFTDNYFTSSWGGELANITGTTTSSNTGISASSTLRAGLVSYWKFDETSGTAYDATSTNALTNNNGTPFITGKISNAADLERASSQSFSIADGSQSGLDITGDVSFSFWVKPETVDFNTVIAKFGASGNRSYRVLQADGGFYLDVINSSDTSAQGAWPTLGLTAGNWYHIVITWKASTSKANLYVNGAVQTEKTTSGVTNLKNSTATFAVGSDSDLAANLGDGLVDEVGVWNRVLTTSEVSGLYGSGSGLAYSTAAEVATSTSEYRHRIEDGRFLKYIYANSTWVAYDKNGTRYQFGSTNQAQQFATTSTSTTVSRWMLEEVRDTNDNFIRYVYTRDGNQLYPSQILYTGSGETDGIFTIDITKSARPDPFISYKNTYYVSTNYRITEIKASINGSWVRKYALSYGSGNNGVRSLLTSVQETGQDDASNQLTLPALTLSYSSSTPGYTANTNSRIWNAAHVASDSDGNGLPEDNIFAEGSSHPQYWAYYSNSYGQGFDPIEKGTRFFDVSGDGKADLIRSMLSRNVNDYTYTVKYYGSNEVEKTIATTSVPIFNYETINSTPPNEELSTGILGNVNGDGLVDYSLSLASGPLTNGTYLHAGTSSAVWNTPTTTFTPIANMPTDSNSQSTSQLIDINGDGLDDWVQSGTGSIEFCINKGTSWDSTCVSPWNIATSSRQVHGWDRGIRFIDVNADGLSDYVRAYNSDPYTNKSPGVYDIEVGAYNYVYLNTGSGWATSTLQMPQVITAAMHTGAGWWAGFVGYDEPIDWNGDGILDQSGYTSTTTKPDLLTQITYPNGGVTNVEYLFSSQLYSGNPNLAFPVLLVSAIGNYDGLGGSATTTYRYSGGEVYASGDVRDRRVAGFETIFESKGDTLTKSYYHQGNTASTTAGELTDHFSKIGRAYRTDVMASSTGTLLKRTFFNWNSLYQGDSRYFAFLSTTTEESFEGNSAHKDRATSYTYDTTTGDVLTQVDWGEVLGASDGTFTDTGSDMATTSTLYAASTSVNMSLPYAASTTDQSGTKFRETRNYYDGQSLGAVTKGNRTKQENWISGSTYASTTRTYNSYGLVTQELDPRAGTTTYAYDTYNLYPATTTNAIDQATGYLYDYAIGKVKQTLDPNTRRTQTLFDPVGRVTTLKQPDFTTPTTLVSKTVYTYATTLPRLVQETNYLNSATFTQTYRYFDGLDRLIQTRKAGENGNYIVQDTRYDAKGLLASSSLPYFGTGASSTSATTTSLLYTSYLYDALDRPVSIANAIGTTANTYDDWHVITTDPRGKTKEFYKDAYDNLSKVIEHVSGTIGTTTYAYDLNKNLTSITDAAANVRSFTYDGLNRRLTAEDLHVSGDGAYGTSTYSYDDAGNLTQQVDPKSQTVNFTYDPLNRPLTEDYTDSAGTEVTYSYDTCTDGIGRLCAATSTDAATHYLYNPVGQVSRELKIIDGAQYKTLFDYTRLGDIASTTFPTLAQTINTYGTGGLLDNIQWRNQGDTPATTITNIDYAPDGQTALIAFANGVTTYKSYDNAGMYRLINLFTGTTSVSATTTLQTLTYQYDANSNIIRIINAASSTATTTLDYAYDDLNRLTAATTTVGGTGAFSGGIAASSTLRAGLVSYWKFDEGSSFSNDATSSNHLSNNNSASYVIAKINNGADIERASSQSFSITDGSQTGLDIVGDISFSFWFKPESVDFNTVIAKFDASGNRSFRVLQADGGFYFDVINSSDTSAQGAWPTLGLTAGNWYHVVVTWKASTSKANLYIDGTAQAEKTTTGVTDIKNSTAAFAVGADSNLAGNLGDGLVDEVGIWNRTLSASEASGLYNGGSGLEYSSGGTGSATSSQAYTYDILGSLLTKSDIGSYTYAGTGRANPHAVTSLAGTTYTYDNNGNVTSVGNKTFSWNYRDRLTQVATGTATTTYAYDHTNQRVRQWVPTVGTSTYANRYFDRLATSTSATSTVYIFAGDMLVATVEGNGTATSTRYVHPDHLGSTNVVTNASGTVLETIEYYPYGSERTNTSTGGAGSRRAFIGQYQDDTADLNYLNARFYQSSRGQFLSEDPVFWEVGLTRDGKTVLANPQAMNSYNYAEGSPIVKKDSTGRCPWCVPFLAGGIVGGLAQYGNDILANQTAGINGPAMYKPRSSWQEYNAAVTTGAITGSVATAGLIYGGIAATLGAGAQDWAGGNKINPKNAVISGITTVATGGFFKWGAGASPAEIYVQSTGRSFSSLPSNIFGNESRYRVADEMFGGMVSTIVQSQSAQNIRATTDTSKANIGPSSSSGFQVSASGGFLTGGGQQFFGPTAQSTPATIKK